MTNALGLSATLESADGFLLLGRRNAAVAYHPLRVHPFAGSATDIDVFAEMRRELAEELAFTASDIADIRCIGMAEDVAIHQPELIFHVVSTQTRRQIEGRLDAAEHDAVWTVRAEKAAVEKASNAEDLTPIARATLHLWSGSGVRPG
jgi:hypothetical protein